MDAWNTAKMMKLGEPQVLYLIKAATEIHSNHFNPWHFMSNTTKSFLCLRDTGLVLCKFEEFEKKVSMGIRRILSMYNNWKIRTHLNRKCGFTNGILLKFLEPCIIEFALRRNVVDISSWNQQQTLIRTVHVFVDISKIGCLSVATFHLRSIINTNKVKDK